MASVLAIISKGMFEKMSKKPKLGDVLDTDRYVSTVPRLATLDEGGALFLVTVRPPKEDLWLVAVLEGPKFSKKDGAWIAAKNSAPMSDLAKVKAKIAFDNGAGIKAKPGALGMSLQTPRILTDADVALLRGALPSSAAPPGASSDKPATTTTSPSQTAEKKPAISRPAQPRTLREACELEHLRSLAPERLDRLARAIEASSRGALRYLRSHGFGAHTVPVFAHVATGATMHLVPGGSVEQGFSATDRAALLPQLEGRADASTARAWAQSQALSPARTVHTPAFLLAAAPLTSAQIAALLLGEPPADDALRALRGKGTAPYRAWLDERAAGRVSSSRLRVLETALGASGLRLANECEWEHAARALRPALFPWGDSLPEVESALASNAHPLGLSRMGALPELCGDAWFATLKGAPVEAATRRPLHDGPPVYALRGGALRFDGHFESDSSPWRYALNAARRPHTDVADAFAVRPVLPIAER